jgi:hypothetical protein
MQRILEIILCLLITVDTNIEAFRKNVVVFIYFCFCLSLQYYNFLIILFIAHSDKSDLHDAFMYCKYIDVLWA